MPAAPMPAARPQRVPLGGDCPPERAAELLGAEQSGVVLTGDWGGVTAIVASEPALTESDPCAALDRTTALQPGDDTVLVGGGWLGLVGYGVAARLADPQTTAPPVLERLPGTAIAFYDHVLVRDADGQWWFEMLWTQERDDRLHGRARLLAQRLASLPPAGPDDQPTALTGPWSCTPTPGGHARAVRACQERIDAGDLYQANLSMRLRAELHGDPAALFAAGVAALAPQRGALVRGPWGAVASFSPELLVAHAGDRVRSEPIKGTRPRPEDPALAERFAGELAEAEKDRAENVMIVDLMRNDLGQLCVPGTIAADPVCEVRAMAGVWQLVSEVHGQTRPGVSPGDIVRAVLPAGSVTGAPKHAALAVIAELESAARQAFCGSVVLGSPVCGLEMSVVIRTLECAGDTVWLDVGGGITATSDPAAEADECLAKAEPVLRAIGASVPARAHADPGPEPLRLGGRPVPRPDPGAGVFTTMHATDGRADDVAEHLARLDASGRALYGAGIPERLGRRVRDVAAQTLEPQRLRVTLLPDGEATVEAFTIAGGDDPVVLQPVCVPGGLGAHKWADRRLVVALEQACAPAEPLLCDLDGAVLEASRWAIAADLDGELVSPPEDGRILPSIGIATLHPMLQPVRRRLTLADLARARAVYVVNAVRGMVPVTEVTGAWPAG